MTWNTELMDEMRVVLAEPGRPYDLLLICALTCVAVMLSILEISSSLVSLIAFPCVFFTPGYALVSAMFPGKTGGIGSLVKTDEGRESEMSLLERVVASVVLSLVVFAIGGIILGWTPGVLNKSTILAEVLVLNLGFSALAIYRRFQLPEGDEFVLAFELEGQGGGKLNTAEKVILGVVAVTLVVAVLAGAGLLWPGTGLEPHTEFYITGPDGSLGTLPQSLVVGANGTVLITFTNHMGGTIDYNLTLGVMSNDAFQNLSALDLNQAHVLVPGNGYYYETTLSDGTKFADTFTFSFGSAGRYMVMFQLSDGQEVQDLWLWVSVS